MTLIIRAPFAGWCTPLAEIPDEVFARAMLGEGVAVDPTGDELRAPCDGEVISVAAARHAVALRAPGGAEMLVHVGIDTVALGGEGFKVHVRKGDRVRAGDLLLSFDLDLWRAARRSLITPVIVTNARALPRRARATSIAGRERRCAVRTRRNRHAGTATPATRTAAAGGSEALVVEHAHGIHARPAALIARVAKTLPYELEVRARGRGANAAQRRGAHVAGCSRRR